jgi:organic radical activating enzyme
MDPSGTLDVHSIFYTFQGEGPFAGTPCVFVRLGGCNLQCPDCDTIYTDKPGDKYKRRLYTAHELVNAVVNDYPVLTTSSKLVVITGGEPFRQNLSPFIVLMLRAGFYIQIETNGSFSPAYAPDDYHLPWFNHNTYERKGVYVVCSPKTGKVNKHTEIVACAYKYVMAYDSVDPEDGLPIYALSHDTGRRVARPPQGVPVYLQPMDHEFTINSSRKHWVSESLRIAEISEQNRRSRQAVLESCLKHGYIFQLQIHKFVGVE